MSDELENMLLQAAGRTGGTSGRKNQSRSQSKRRREDSYSDGSFSNDDGSDNAVFSKRRNPGPQVPLKKRFDLPEKDERYTDDESEDDSESAPSIGSDLYKDEEDKEELEKLSELQREMILADRGAKRDDYRLKQKVRETTSTTDTSKTRKESTPSPPSLPSRSRPSLRSDKSASKNSTVKEILAKRMKQHEPSYKKVTDSSPAKIQSSTMHTPDSSDSEGGDNDDDKDVSADDNDADTIDDISGSLKFEDIKAITIRRSKLAKWFMEPFFEELIVGCFVRVGIGKTKTGNPMYRLCMVKNVDASDPSKQYKLENKTTHKWLNCVWGNEATAARWQMAMISDSPPIEEEFKQWAKEVEKHHGRLPSRKEVIEKQGELQKANNYVYSAATVKQMLQEKKSTASRPLNVALEKDRLRKQIDMAKMCNDDAEVERIEAKIKELEEKSRLSKNKDDKAVKLAEMNRKNRAENFKNASEMKPVNIGLKAGEAGYDPFSRRWTRSTNYYVSKAPINGEVTAAAEVRPANGTEDGKAATVAALEAAKGEGKLIDTNAPVDQKGAETNSLHDFELEISLVELHKFGGAQGVQSGFLARKQKIEATVGYKVPDNDGRRHALTLTVSDYKRRRGLL